MDSQSVFGPEQPVAQTRCFSYKVLLETDRFSVLGSQWLRIVAIQLKVYFKSISFRSWSASGSEQYLLSFKNRSAFCPQPRVPQNRSKGSLGAFQPPGLQDSEYALLEHAPFRLELSPRDVIHT